MKNNFDNTDLNNVIDIKTDDAANTAKFEAKNEDVLSEEEIARREKLQDEAIKNFAIASENVLAAETSGKKVRKDIPERNKVRPIPEKQRETGDDSKHIGRIVLFFVRLLIVAILVYCAYYLGKNGYRFNIGNSATVSPYPTAGAEKTEKSTFAIENLRDYVKLIKPEDVAPFTVSAEKYYGYEYLCLTSGKLRLYYRNEYPADFNEPKRLVIDNGRFRTEMSFNYDLTGNIRSLVPMVDSEGDNGPKFLLFVTADEGGYPIDMKLIDAEKVFNYGTVSFADSLKACYKSSLTEEPAAVGQNSRSLLKFTFSGVDYVFSVSKTTYTEGVMYNNDVINTHEGFTFDFTEKGISFSTEVTTIGGEYLGRITGNAVASGTDFVLSNVTFGAYTTAYEAGYGKDNVITARTSPLPQRLTIISRTGQRYYLPVIDDIKQRSFDFKDLVFNDEKGTYEYVVDGKVMSYSGIDVSKFQGEIDWKKVKESGIDFAIIRLGYRGYGEGTLELDEYFEKNIKGATEAGIKVGVYYFSQAINVEEAKEEAEYVLDRIKDYHIDYPVIFDTEDISGVNARANNLTIWERTAVARVFCDVIKAGGYRPMIYSNVRYMLTGIDLTQLDDIERWFAYYSTDSRFPYDFSIFQYSDKGKVDGINGVVDLDISFIDYSMPE